MMADFRLNKELHQGMELEKVDKWPKKSTSYQAEPEAGKYGKM